METQIFKCFQHPRNTLLYLAFKGEIQQSNMVIGNWMRTRTFTLDGYSEEDMEENNKMRTG